MRPWVPFTVRTLPFTAGDWFVITVLGSAALLALGWLLAAASLYVTTEVPARGGVYYEGVIGVPRFINPVLALSDADRDLTSLVHAGLMRMRPDGTLEPDLAESYTVSEDQKTYTFTLRADAQFHDGTPVTAADVSYTVLLVQNPAMKSPRRPHWEGVTVRAVDDRTVSFMLKSPYAPFIYNTSMGILPKHVWEGVAVDEFPFSTRNVHALGAGPYRITRVTDNAAGIPQTITLTAFRKSPSSPYIAEFIFNFYPDSDALYAALRANPELAAHSVPPEAVAGRRIEEAVLGRVFGVFFNQSKNDLFADPAIRRALDEALDKNALIATLVGGYGSPIRGPLPPAHSDILQQDVLASTTVEDRVSAARERLAAAGWSAGSDGILEKKDKKAVRRLAFTLATGNAPELKLAAEEVAAVWRQLGAEVTTQFFEAGDLQQEVIRPRNYQALLFGEAIGRDMDLFAFWHSSQRNDPGLNVALYVNNTVDKKLAEARTASDPAARRTLVEEAAAIIADERAAVFLYSPHFVYAVPPSLRGLALGSIASPADRFLGVTDWYLETERVWPIFAY